MKDFGKASAVHGRLGQTDKISNLGNNMIIISPKTIIIDGSLLNKNVDVTQERKKEHGFAVTY